MNLIQYVSDSGQTGVAVLHETGARTIPGASGVYDLALAAIAAGITLESEITSHGKGDAIDPGALAAAGRLLPPITHPDPAHLVVTGTGLTHLGSASARDAMHQSMADTGEEKLTDSMKMFRMGLEGGKPAPGEVGAQPEWFYKGNGNILVAPGQPIPSPAFAEDAGEEPEMAGIYVVGLDGVPRRLGFALANEFSDHVTERGNYLWLAHSKLRHCSLGPVLRIGDLPHNVQGMSRILRNGKVIWEKPFLSGEDNMSHTIANLEHHHFKYDIFRQPGDVHVHMFGTATLSFADGVTTDNGDTFEISAAEFSMPLVNPIAVQKPAPSNVELLY